jgi:hypothetical protein
MVLYKKVFPLGERISFSNYIKALEKKRFPNYYLRIEKIPSTTNYHGTLVFTLPNWEWSLRGPFRNGVFFKECMIQYSEGERQFSIRASTRTGNVFFAVSVILFFILMLSLMFFQNSLTPNNIVVITAIAIVMLAPSTLIYLQDKIFLDKVGSLGSHFQES